MSNYNQIKNIDIIIIGAGLSGLSLARELSIKKNKNILIIYKKKKTSLRQKLVLLEFS